MKGIRRTAASALTRKTPAAHGIISDMIARCPDTVRGRRDRALLLLGFAGAVRRSELAALTVADLVHDDAGLRVHVRRSKTDLDGVFIGRADLSVALGAAGPEAEAVKSATSRIAAAARAAGKPVSAMTADPADARWLRELGINALVVSSDQGLLRQASLRALTDFRETCK